MKVAEGKGGDYVLYVKIIKVMARIGRKRRVKSSMGSECKGLISNLSRRSELLPRSWRPSVCLPW